MTPSFMDFLLVLLPIGVLIGLLLKKNPWTSFSALVFSSGILYALRMFYFDHSPTLIHAGIVQGLLSAWTPILIIWGAIILFQTMENSYSLHTIREWLNSISNHKIAQIMIIGWAFIFFIEGASGFGTPTALAAPLLVGLGFKDKFKH